MKPAPVGTVTIRVELEPREAAALRRLCDKFAHADAAQYLYAHLPRDIRTEQAYDMVYGTTAVATALSEAGVSAHPWIETGAAS